MYIFKFESPIIIDKMYDNCTIGGKYLSKIKRPHHVVFTTSRYNLSGAHRIIHQNVILSLKSLDRVTVIDYVNNTIDNVYGMPILKYLYRDAMCRYRNADTYTYINGDIVLWNRALETLDVVVESANKGIISKRFLVSGTRFNVNFNSSMDLEKNASDNIYRWIGQSKKDTGWAIDYFSVSPSTWGLWDDMPPFVIGRRAFDNHINCVAKKDPNITWIDSSKTIPAIHQTFFKPGRTPFNFRKHIKNKADIDFNVRHNWSLKAYNCGIMGRAKVRSKFNYTSRKVILITIKDKKKIKH